MPHFDTAANVINSAAKELALVSSAVADPWASTDENILQLTALLTRAGRMLVRARPWSHLVQEYTFSTVNGTASYALPTGFERFRDSTAWNRDTTMPMGGPLNSAQWQAVKAQTSSGMVVRPFRIQGNLLYIYPTPSAAETIAYEYVSRYWVMPTGQTSPTTDEATATTDTIWLDEPLVVAALKLAFRRAKGFDTTAAQAEFDEVYSAAAGGDGAAPVLHLTSPSGVVLLSDANVPDTGYGS